MSARNLMLQSSSRGGALWVASVLTTVLAFPTAYLVVPALVMPSLAFVLGYLSYRQQRRQRRRPDDSAGVTTVLPMVLAVLAQFMLLAILSHYRA